MNKITYLQLNEMSPRELENLFNDTVKSVEYTNIEKRDV